MPNRLEDYYHDGNESVNRADVKAAEAIVEKIKMGSSAQIKELKQQKYMHPDNPLLWTGDFDDD